MCAFETKFLYRENSCDWAQNEISFHNRGFLYADGFFETMVYCRGQFRFRDLHQKRVDTTLPIFNMEAQNLSSVVDLEKLIFEQIGESKTCRVRWNIFRNSGGKYTPKVNGVLESLQIEPFLSAPSKKKSAYISQTIRVPQLPWSNSKTLNALIYVMANLERMKSGFDEVILLDQNGFVCEAGSSNLFWVKSGDFFTPSLAANPIGGIARAAIIQKLKERNIKISEGLLSPHDILEADVVFTSNVTGISYIQKIHESEFKTTPIPWLEEMFAL